MRSVLSILLFAPLLIQAQQPVKQLVLKKPYTSSSRIKTIRERKGSLTIIPAKTRWLTIGGNYTSSAGASSVTAAPYNNSIFRTAHQTGQSLSVLANIKDDTWKPLWTFSLKATTNTETTVIPDNLNTSQSLSLTAERHLEKFSIAGSYSYFSSRFSNDNSNGFLNRVYQNALLTPAGNPWFPLKDNAHLANRVQQTGNLSLQKKQGSLDFGVNTTLDAIGDTSNESLQPGTAFFPKGLIYTRQQKDDHYASNAWLAYRTNYGGHAFFSTARLNYIYN